MLTDIRFWIVKVMVKGQWLVHAYFMCMHILCASIELELGVRSSGKLIS